MGKFNYTVSDGTTPMPQIFNEDHTRDEVIRDLQDAQWCFSLQSSNVYFLNGDIQVHMVGRAFGKPYAMQGYFTNVREPYNDMVYNTLKVGTWEGERCNRNGCAGVLIIRHSVDGGCYCPHTMPPCGYCTSSYAHCPVCDYTSND